jgi:hypothetical protein
MPIELTRYELTLLPKALSEVRQDSTLTRDDLKRLLHCGSDIAQRLLTHIQANEMVKIAERLQALPVAAEVRAETQFILGDTSGSSYSYVLRENSRLQKALAKYRMKTEAEKEQRETEIRQEIEELKALAKEQIQRKPQAVKPRKDTGLMLELALSDHHFGKLAWPAETNGRPYDVKIAEATFMRAIEQLLELSKGFEFEQILLLVGNDIFHSNDAAGNTANGTRLDTEGRFHKTYWTVRKMLCKVIERLSEIAPVKVPILLGNHDKLSAWTLGDSLECYFEGDPNVVIENAPTYRKYHEFGKVLLMFTHGDLGKRLDYPLLMATENSAAFGRTQFREVHTGHLHTTRTEEIHGVRVRILPALCPADSWHHENGYVGSLRTAESYVWSREQGLIAQFFHNDDAFPVIKTKTEIV